MRLIRLVPPLLGCQVLTCRDVSELATDYVEGAMQPRERLAMRVHLFLCRMCRNYLDQLAKTRRLLVGRVMDGPSAELESQILAALHGARKPPAE
jgi:hypothetical protein